MPFTDGGRNNDEDDPEDEPAIPAGWRDGEPETTPPNFHRWDRQAQVTYLELGHTRADLLAHIRGYIDSDRGSDRLSKEELAKIALDLNAIIP